MPIGICVNYTAEERLDTYMFARDAKLLEPEGTSHEQFRKITNLSFKFGNVGLNSSSNPTQELRDSNLHCNITNTNQNPEYTDLGSI